MWNHNSGWLGLSSHNTKEVGAEHLFLHYCFGESMESMVKETQQVEAGDGGGLLRVIACLWSWA